MIENEYESALADFKTALKAKLKQFYPIFGYGTEFYKGKGNDFFLACGKKAAECINGLFVLDAESVENGVLFNVIINEEERQVFVEFEYNC